MDLHVLPQGAGVRVRFIAASDFAVIRLVTGVDVGVFLSVTTIGKLPVAAIELAFKRLLSCNGKQESLSSGREVPGVCIYIPDRDEG